MNQKYNSPQEEALEIAISTRRKIIEGDVDVLSVIRACFIIASNLSKTEDLEWINGELYGHTKSTTPSYRNISLPKEFEKGFKSLKLAHPIQLLSID